MRRLLRRWLGHDWRVVESERAELAAARRGHGRQSPRDDPRRLDSADWIWRLGLDRLRSRLARDGGGSGSGRRLPRGLWRDLRDGARSVRRSPGLSGTIVLTVGVGLGATTAMVAVAHAVVIDPLSYSAPADLVLMQNAAGSNTFPFSVADYRALDAEQRAFTNVAGFAYSSVTVTGQGAAERVRASTVTWSYFSLLGLQPALGRLFERGDSSPQAHAVVLDHGYWMTHFGGRPDVVGTSVVVDGVSYQVLGVLQGEAGPLGNGVALYALVDWPAPPRKGPFFIRVLGRLGPGVTREAATEDLAPINRRVFLQYQSSFHDDKAIWTLQDLKARVVGSAGDPVLLVCAAVGCVLLLACANAANLLVARALARRREMAVRSALGASAGRLVQQSLGESLVLAAASALAGLAVAAMGVALVRRFGAGNLPRIADVRLGAPAWRWLAALAAASAALLGAVPAWGHIRGSTAGALADSSRGATYSLAARRIRAMLVATEFALATPLVVLAALVASSLNHLQHVDVGIHTSDVLTASISLPVSQFPDSDAHTFWLRAEERVAAIPGVEAVAFADGRPPADLNQQNNFDLEDRPTQPGQHQPVSPWVGVTPDYFSAVRLPLIEGRLLDARDALPTAPPVVVVDRAWAARFYPGEGVLGRRFHEGGCATCPWTTVVGLVGTVKYLGLDKPDEGTVYWPLLDSNRNRYLVVRAQGDVPAIGPSLRQAIRELDPTLAVAGMATVAELVDRSLDLPRSLSLLVAAFALAALVLSAVGVYGVMAYFVTQHAREMGIRLALGASPALVRRVVLGRGLSVVGGGVAIGLLAAWMATRVLSSFLFGVTPTDPGILVAVPVALVLVAAAVCFAPARRAATVDPAVVLRDG